MSDTEERTVGDLKIVIERSLCVAFAQCIDEAEEAFRLDDNEIVVFAEPEQVGRERLIAACKACPVEAIRVFDSAGAQLAP
jgi:ferredoxin